MFDWIGNWPAHFISYLTGRAAHLKLPAPLAEWSIRIFVKLLNIDASQAQMPLSDYHSIGDYFTRDIRPDLRPISGKICCPVDGRLREHATVSEQQTVDVKGLEYPLAEFFGITELPKNLVGARLSSFYLSPQDGHHIFAPCNAKIISAVHIPGSLWPVNSWGLNNVHGLFARNERIHIWLDSGFGQIVVSLVGALNVGSMSLSFDSNSFGRNREKEQRSYDLEVSQGEKLATFHLGSSVILTIEGRGLESAALISADSAVKYGQALY